MLENKDHIIALYRKFLDNKTTPEETDFLLAYLGELSIDGKDKEEIIKIISAEMLHDNFPDDLSSYESRTNRIYGKIDLEINKVQTGGIKIIEKEYVDDDSYAETREEVVAKDFQPKQSKTFGLWRYVAAAVVLFIVSIGSYHYYNNRSVTENLMALSQEIQPGSDRATLTLADGSVINLRDDQNGIIMGGDSIAYLDGKSILTHVGPNEVKETVNMLVLSTPNGGQYQISLPDGTKVWLNAATTLKYPSRFNENERRVELMGEAYFEVAKNTRQPFIVESAQQVIEVLGTHFNINAYDDENSTKTTLLEGSVQVRTVASDQVISNEVERTVGLVDESQYNQGVILIPGQQSTITNSKIKINSIDPSSIIGWKNGMFIFQNTSLKNIMLQLKRWYNVEIDILSFPNQSFYGEVKRDVPLSNVLKMIEDVSQLKFKIVAAHAANKEGRIIMD